MQQVANQQEAAEPADNSAATEAARTAQQATQAAQTVQSVTGELAALDGEYETLLEEVRRVSRWDGGRGWVGLSWVTQLCVCVRVCTWRLQLKQQSEADASTLAAKQSLERARQKQSLEVRTHHHVLLLCRTSPNPLRASQARRQRALERRAAAKRRLAEAQAAEEAARLLREELGQTEVSGDEVALAEQVSEAASAVTAANMEVDDIDLDLTAVIDAVCDSCCACRVRMPMYRGRASHFVFGLRATCVAGQAGERARGLCARVQAVVGAGSSARQARGAPRQGSGSTCCCPTPSRGSQGSGGSRKASGGRRPAEAAGGGAPEARTPAGRAGRGRGEASAW